MLSFISTTPIFCTAITTSHLTGSTTPSGLRASFMLASLHFCVVSLQAPCCQKRPDFSYLALLFTVFWLIFRMRQKPVSQLLLAEMLVCLLSPMGIRWLTDGMETSLTNLFVVALALVVKSEQISTVQRWSRHLLLVIFGAAIVYLRIELALIIALACASIAISKLERTGPVSAVAEASPLALGGLLALLSIRASLGHFLPDTALAKSGHASLSPLFATMQVFGSAVLLGFGCVLAWASSWILSLRRILSYSHHRATSLLISVLENCPLFIIVALSCLRGQRIQGVRYVIWPLIFGIIANAVQIAREDLEYPVRFRLETVTKWMTIAFASHLPMHTSFGLALGSHGHARQV